MRNSHISEIHFSVTHSWLLYHHRGTTTLPFCKSKGVFKKRYR